MLKNLFASYWLTLVIAQTLLVEAQRCLEPYCFCADAKTLRCSNFTRFDQLDFTRTNNYVFEVVEIRPLVAAGLDLNERLSFRGLRLNGRVSMSNIRSFTAFYNPFRQIVYDRLDISFFNSYFTFVGPVGLTGNMNAEQQILDNCQFTQAAENFDFVFAGLNVNEFVMCNVFFERKMCPILFRNSNIRDMIVNDPTGAYGFETLKTPNNDPIYVLNTNINQIDFSYSADNLIQPQWLDADYIMNPDLFVRTDRININSARRLAYIQEDTFKKLSGIRIFEINNVRLRDLLTYNRLWLRNLNYHMVPFDLDYVALNQSISPNVFQLLIWTNDDDWTFNEERDICLFKGFPHERLVFPFLLFSKPTLPCTCTIYWLYKYFNRYQQLYNLNQNVVPLHCFQNSYWDKCHFKTLFHKYCPDDQPDPVETFTTLKPSVDFVSATKPPCCTSEYYPTSTGITLYPPQTPSTSYHTLFTTSYYPTSSSMALIDFSNCTFSVIAFYLAIALSVIAAFVIAALIVLYYLVWKRRRQRECLVETRPPPLPHSVCPSSAPAPRVVVTDYFVVDTSFISTSYGDVDGSTGGVDYATSTGEIPASCGITVPCNGTCADCNASIYI